MEQTTHASSRLTWRCGTLGGVVAIVLTIGFSVLSGAGTGLSLTMAFVAGVLAGYLASRHQADADSAGLRAGVLGALPGLWFVFEVLVSVGTAADLTWFHVVGAGTVILLFTTALLVLAALAGFVGATAGTWLSGRSRYRSQPLTSR